MDPSHKRSVLVVDDQENWRNLMTKLLEKDFQVVSVKNFDEAIEALLVQSPPFHVVVTDIRLVDEIKANEDGLRLAEKVNEFGGRTQIIVITGYPSLSTMRKAYKSLNAFDYLEKTPSSGEPFNPSAFRNLVHRAAEKADSFTPVFLTRMDPAILVIEPNPDRRDELAGILKGDGYEPFPAANLVQLAALLEKSLRNYSLIVLNEDYAHPELFELLHKYHVEARVILLTRHDVGELLREMKKNRVIDAFEINGKKFRKNEFRETVRQAFAPEAIKYFCLETIPGRGEFIIGQPFQLNLSIQDVPGSNGTVFWLPPASIRNISPITVNVVEAPQMQVFPGVEIPWTTYLSQVLPIEITPLEGCKGEIEIVIELEMDNRFLGRNTTTVQVRAS